MASGPNVVSFKIFYMMIDCKIGDILELKIVSIEETETRKKSLKRQ